MVLLMGLWFTVVIFLLGIPRDDCAQIIGGRESVPHSRPFMAKITGPKLCGGTLIKSNWVLTAAHCKIIDRTKVSLGIHSEKDSTKQVFRVKRKIPHPCYDSVTKENDIMLLQLDKPAKLNKNVTIVKWAYGDLEEGTECLVAGWGVNESESTIPSEVLREVDVTVIARSTCNDRKHYYHHHQVTMNMVCAGDKKGGKDACAGDSGGPLMCKGEQRAIVSFGINCGESQYPGVYTLLTHKYSNWIKSVIQGSL